MSRTYFDAVDIKPGKSAFVYKDNVLETPFAVVTFDEAGRIVSLFDKRMEREMISEGGRFNRFLIGEDNPAAWDNWDVDRDQRLKMADDDRLVSRKIVSDGPLQIRIRSEYDLGVSSHVTQDMIFYSDSARIDFDTVIDWSEKHQLFKAAFDTSIFSSEVLCEIQYGHIARPTHDNLPEDRAKFEVCNHKWADLAERGCGVAMMNDCKYGMSAIGGTLTLTLMKGGRHPDPRADKGQHRVTYSIMPHDKPFSAETVIRPAYELNYAPVVGRAAAFDSSASFATVDKPDVIIESVKLAEDGKGLVMRLYETERTTVNAVVKPGFAYNTVYETNLLEEKTGDVVKTDDGLKLTFHPFEIKTLYFAL